MASNSPVGRWEAWLSRWGAPITYISVVVGAGLVLVGVITRSPDTKSNFQASAEGYHRTTLATIGTDQPYLGLQHEAITTEDPAQMFVQAGCSNCHGLHGQGGAVGPPIWTLSASTVTKTLRAGAVGMPTFKTERLTDAQIASLAAYLNDFRKKNPDEPEVKPARAGAAAPAAPTK